MVLMKKISFIVCRKHTDTGMVYFNDLNNLKRLESAWIALKRKSIELDVVTQAETSESGDLKKNQAVNSNKMEINTSSAECSPTKKLKS